MARSSSEKAARRGFRLMPLTVTMLALLLIIKVNEVYIGSRQLRELYDVRDASAQEKKEGDQPADNSAPKDNAEATKSDAKADGKDAAAPASENAGGDAAATEGESKDASADSSSDKKEEGGDASSSGSGDKQKESGYKKDKPIPGVNRTYGTGKTDLKDIDALKAKESTPQFTQTEIDLLENLSKRRDELDQRAKDLDLKEQVLNATEKRINDKISEMKTLQVTLDKVVAQYNEKEDAQIKSLVKIYENMKPIDAANIFNQLDMPILLEVIDKMSERKVAPILAAMDPRKARDVTQELAAMRQQVKNAGGEN